MAWTNKDGLVVWFGTELAETQPGGINTKDAFKTLTHKFTFADVATPTLLLLRPTRPSSLQVRLSPAQFCT